MSKNFKKVIHELKHHSPFTLIATILAILIVVAIKFVLNLNFEEEAFEIFHPLHVIASSIVSAAIFYKYKPKIIPALFVGIISAILIGSISDIIFPYLGTIIFGLNPEFHLPLIEEPFVILGASLIGSIIGVKTRFTRFPHFIHVGLSVFASLFYILAFTQVFSIISFIIALVIVFISVIIPCCISDILLPFFFLGKDIKNCNCPN